MSNRPLDELFKEKLTDAEVAPPPHMWNRIAPQIPPAVSTTPPNGLAKISKNTLALSAVILLVSGWLVGVATYPLLFPTSSSLTTTSPTPHLEVAVSTPTPMLASTQVSSLIQPSPSTAALPISSDTPPALHRTKASAYTHRSLSKSNLDLDTTLDTTSPITFALAENATSSIAATILPTIIANNAGSPPSAIAEVATPIIAPPVRPLLNFASLPQNALPAELQSTAIREVASKSSTREILFNTTVAARLYRPNIPLGLHVGLIGGGALTGIRNRQLAESSAISPQGMALHAHYGLKVGYDFSEHFGIHAYLVNARHEQRYTLNTHRINTEQSTSVKLQYTQIPVLARYSFNMPTRFGLPMQLSCLAGVQYGMLSSAAIHLNNPTLQETLLRKSSWGVVGGFDYDIYLTPSYYFSLGTRATIATPTNSFGQVAVPNAKTTNNISFGLQAGITYKLGK